MRHLWSLSLLVLAAPVAAQTPAPPALPNCNAAEFRQFDFWAGDWVVTDSAGTTQMGANSVTKEEAGCVLHEHWTGARGPSGQSFNAYNRQTKKWVQHWVSSIGNVLDLEGGLVGPAMRLEGDTRTPAGATVRNRIEWTLQPDGRVRQTWSISNDNGATWTKSFDGWYKRKA